VSNSNKLTVKTFDGTAWVDVGTAGFSAGEATYASMAISGNHLVTSYIAGSISTGGGVFSQHITIAPNAATSAPTSVANTTAVLNGSVNDRGANTTVSFKYGTAADLTGGTTVAATTGGSVTAGSGNTTSTYSLSGLVANTTYYYQVSATNSGGTTNGS